MGNEMLAVGGGGWLETSPYDNGWGEGRGGWVSVCASARRGGAPILAFPREGGRERGGWVAVCASARGGGHPHPNLPPSRGKGGERGMGPRPRLHEGGYARGHRRVRVFHGGDGSKEGRGDGSPHSRGNGRGSAGGFMGGMVARGVEGMGCRVREETGGGTGAGRGGSWGDGCEGGRGDGSPHARGNGRGARERRGVGGRGDGSPHSRGNGLGWGKGGRGGATAGLGWMATRFFTAFRMTCGGRYASFRMTCGGQGGREGIGEGDGFPCARGNGRGARERRGVGGVSWGGG